MPVLLYSVLGTSYQGYTFDNTIVNFWP